MEVEAIVLSELRGFQPQKTLHSAATEHLCNLQFADPNWHHSGRIDILLDAYVYSRILNGGLRKQLASSPIAQETEVGWILSGTMLLTQPLTSASLLVSTIDSAEVVTDVKTFRNRRSTLRISLYRDTRGTGLL